MTEIAADRLRSYVERIERLEGEKREIATDVKEVYVEVKAAGLDPKIVRKIVALRRRDQDDIDEEEALLETYKRALGMLADTPLGEASLRSHKLTAGLAAAAGVEGTLKAIRETEAA